MPQVFPRMTNVVSRWTLVGALATAPFLVWGSLLFSRSSYGTDAGVMREQPIPFSHQHHVGVLAIDCRYCHTSVEHSGYAGMPATKTCMNCHSQIWVGSAMLKPVRDSYKNDQPLAWRRVYNLPGFVYFEHSVHVQNGIGCSSCHGQIDQMPFTYQVPTLLMEWCLDCHRHPERNIRPREEVFNVQYRPPADQLELGRELVKQYGIANPAKLTSCSICHR